MDFFSGKEQLCKWDKYLAKNNFANRIASNCKIWHQGASRKKNTRLLWGLTSCERQRPSQAPSFKISSFISKGYMHVRKSQRSYQYINIVVTKFFYGTTTWSTDVALSSAPRHKKLYFFLRYCLEDTTPLNVWKGFLKLGQLYLKGFAMNRFSREKNSYRCCCVS